MSKGRFFIFFGKRIGKKLGMTVRGIFRSVVVIGSLVEVVRRVRLFDFIV